MLTMQEAMALCRSRGFPANCWIHGDHGSMVVSARARAFDPTSSLRVLHEPHWLYTDSHGYWEVRYKENVVFVFDSLPDAINAILPRLQEWLASHPDE